MPQSGVGVDLVGGRENRKEVNWNMTGHAHTPTQSVETNPWGFVLRA